MVVVVAVVVLITGYKYFTRVDRSDATAVASAFTSAMKSKDTGAASNFYVPDRADQWREKTDEYLSSMRSGAKERFFEGIPQTPEFGPVATVADKSLITSADKSYTLEMSQVDGKWYVAKTNFDR